MQKIFILSLFSSVITFVQADTPTTPIPEATVQVIKNDNSVDHAQPRPDSTVTATVITEQKKITEAIVGDKVIDSKTDVSLTPSVEKIAIESPAKSLPPAKVFDSSVDLEKTMKMMGKNFKALKGAESIADMKQAAAELAKWASQAEALGIETIDGQAATAEQIKTYKEGIQQLRKEIADLEISIENNDSDAAQTLINQIGDTRKQGHKYFKVK